MGERGPVPKRTTERRRRNKPETPVTSVTIATPTEPPPPPEDLHPVALGLYLSMKDSGQARFFEPTDWHMAQAAVLALSKALTGTRFSAIAFSAAWSACMDLLTTEAARRRARIEIERGLEEQADPGVTAIAEARKRLRGSR